MSGNFVQRGDFAVFNKYSRALAALRCGADLVVELPAPYALSSAESFASAGVQILDALGVCDYLSFGSESGRIYELADAAAALQTDEFKKHFKVGLKKGYSYAQAHQNAADFLLGKRSAVFMSPNNLLGILYLKAIAETGSRMLPVTIKRTGGLLDGDCGYSASALRSLMRQDSEPWQYMPDAAAEVYREETSAGRGPVFMEACELAVLSRLRAVGDYSRLPGVSEGLHNRFKRYAVSEPTIEAILGKVKTKRYAMSRLRRLLLSACLGITSEDARLPPQYIRVLGMNSTGRKLLSAAREKAKLPIITKPASVHNLPGDAALQFQIEVEATDFYVLAYPDKQNRAGGQEWRFTPVVI